ncbi:hypothetical protein PHYBLDRAFT_58888 [Phycomyces blakesleeanus NRRL 1555(-)]|uniref:Uncharacterized protein n=1 Tax=Phycomyces blakesleeanus (strain ATCC 8743b / DSM 1359 / FGSC 10004 / NBRC 33097 / NRRL 1555) TaxID=763407 RepID=A0A162V4B2_PHYB8|nr:hypothetical protein PHYBLDRAFT_58888 [Phycomyces blakesleeanus NRRL 1555(-)]OAD79843.1 hypothetical protein PHYBLDRAFT_58888 [Phycomyces blakesleeanus NRRL 1555(-)]|eukprot:XP_018297883.1 hypothetical protein PHYBLDRAFT_58888 [Phycomyces blakesleeanus NRRL 1555(-)]
MLLIESDTKDMVSLENVSGAYYKSCSHKYECRIYVHPGDFGAAYMSLIVGMSLSTVEYFIKIVDKSKHSELIKGFKRVRYIEGKTESHTINIIVSCPKRLEFGACIAANKPN